MRVGAAGASLAARLARAAGARRGRGVSFVTTVARGYPRPLGLEPGTVGRVSILDIGVTNALSGEDASLASAARRQGAARRQRGLEVRADPAVRGPGGAARAVPRPRILRARLPVQPVRRPGARDVGGDRHLLLDDVRRDVPDVREDRRQRRRPAPDLRAADLVPDAEGEAGDIQWNFEKFLVAPDGEIVAAGSGRRRSPKPPKCSPPSRRFSRVRPAGRRRAWPAGRAMITRWISLVPSQIRSTRSSRKKRSATFSRM